MRKLLLCAAGMILFLGAKPNYSPAKENIVKEDISSRLDSLDKGLSKLKPRMENLMQKLKR